MSRRSPVVLALLSAALFGASTPLAKSFLDDVAPGLLAGVLYLGAGIGLVAFRMLRGGQAEAPLRRRDLPWMALVVVFGGVLGPLLLMSGLARTPAATAALLLNLESVATLAIAWVVFRENVDRRILAGAACIVAGAALLSWQPGQGLGAGWGAVAIAAACLAWGIDNNLTRKLSASDPAEIAAVKGLVAGGVNVVIAVQQGAGLPSPGVLVAAGLLGLAGYGVSLALFIVALRHLGTARTGAYFATAPFLGASFAVILLGEPLSPGLIGAAVLMLAGVYLHLTERHEHEHVHETVVHEHRHVHDEHHRHVHAADAPAGEPHTHPHRHVRMIHRHPHYPDLHHRHRH